MHLYLCCCWTVSMCIIAQCGFKQGTWPPGLYIVAANGSLYTYNEWQCALYMCGDNKSPEHQHSRSRYLKNKMSCRCIVKPTGSRTIYLHWQVLELTPPSNIIWSNSCLNVYLNGSRQTVISPALDPSLKSHSVQGPFRLSNNNPLSPNLSHILTNVSPFLPVILRFIWSWLWTLECCQQSSGLVLRAPPVHAVCSALHWELPLQHSLQWMRSLLSPLALLFPLFPPQQDRKTEEIQRERGRVEAGREGCKD